jgi:hypothetical protein
MAADARRLVDQVFLTRRGRPRLVRCAVLFVDLLGVRAMNHGGKAAAHLVALERAVNGTYRNFLEPDSPWPAAFFSDTLVLASPVRPDGDEESAIGGLILQAAWLQLDLIGEGFFVRGGMSIGQLHIRDGFVFGPALVEAYELESREAIHPRIVLSSEVKRSQRADLRYYSDPRYAPQSSLLLCDDDGHTFISYLGALFEDLDDPEPGLERHRDAVRQQLRTSRGDKRRWEKYRWLAEYHNAVVRRALGDASELCVDAGEMTWRFTTFA